MISSINDFFNRQRASYFSYVNNLPNKRLCKIVFDEMHVLSAHAWDYLPALKTEIYIFNVYLLFLMYKQLFIFILYCTRGNDINLLLLTVT
jgi:hypothetical protein